MAPALSQEKTHRAAHPDATTTRGIVVCADDFGMDAAVSAAIVELLQAERLSATSVLVFGPDSRRAEELLSVHRRGRCSIGLHFTLTEMSGWPGSSKLPALVARSHLRLLRAAGLREELTRQLDRFEDLLGVRPEFLDGHEHVHQLPVVSDVVMDTLAKRYGTPGRFAIRTTKCLAARGTKASLLGLLGGNRLGVTAPARGLITNTDFAGVYSFQRTGHYRERVLGWLRTLTDGGLLMCHPGADAQTSSIGKARYEEYCYLRSSQWLTDLTILGVRLVPFPRHSRSPA